MKIRVRQCFDIEISNHEANMLMKLGALEIFQDGLNNPACYDDDFIYSITKGLEFMKQDSLLRFLDYGFNWGKAMSVHNRDWVTIANALYRLKNRRKKYESNNLYNGIRYR